MNYIAGADNPMGSISRATNVSFRKTALNSVLYGFFYDFIHAGTGADNSNGVNF